jgi:hypothetical protein
MTVRTWIAALVLVQACDDDLSSGPRLLAPEEVSFAWDEAWDEADDGLLALVPLDVMVYDGATGEPRADAELALRVSGGALLPVEAVEAGEDGCADCVWDAWSDLPVRLFGVASVASVASVAGDGAQAWSSVAVAGSAADGWVDVHIAGTPGLAALNLRTDARGLARVYVVVDALNRSSGANEAAGSEAAPEVLVETRHPGDAGDGAQVIARTRLSPR